MKMSTGESKICLLQCLCLSLCEQESFFLHFSFFSQNYFSQQDFKEVSKLTLLNYKKVNKKDILSLILDKKNSFYSEKNKFLDQMFLFVATYPGTGA